MDLGLDYARYLHFDGSNELLLELSRGATKYDFVEYERTIYELQGRGYPIIIAHPERCRAIQQDIDIAQRLVSMGCKLQASADFIAGGRFRQREASRP